MFPQNPFRTAANSLVQQRQATVHKQEPIGNIEYTRASENIGNTYADLNTNAEKTVNDKNKSLEEYYADRDDYQRSVTLNQKGKSCKSNEELDDLIKLLMFDS